MFYSPAKNQTFDRRESNAFSPLDIQSNQGKRYPILDITSNLSSNEFNGGEGGGGVNIPSNNPTLQMNLE